MKLSSYLDRVASLVEKALPHNKHVAAFVNACDKLADGLDKSASNTRTASSIMRWIGGDKPLKVIVGSRCRISIYQDVALLVEELPGKPVKRTIRVGVVYKHHEWRVYGEDLLRTLRLTGNESFDTIADKVKEAIAEEFGPDAVRNLWRQDDRNFLEMEPVDYAPIIAKGDGVTIYSEWNKFKVRAEEEEARSEYYSHSGDPHYSYMESSAPAGARKLFKMLKAKPDMFRGMKESQVLKLLEANKIGTKYRGSYWG